jgi:ferric-dicitrate binding protein FerR (iron transport regulator)
LWQSIEHAIENRASSSSAKTVVGTQDLSGTRIAEETGTKSGSNSGPGPDVDQEKQPLSGPRSWRRQKPVIRKNEPVPRMNVSWLPLLARVAALLALVAFIWLLLTRDQFHGPELIAQTGSAKQAVTLLDGSRVTLRPYSELHRISEAETGLTYRISGEGYFEVFATERERRFSVLTDDARVVVTGTSFTVSNWDRHTRVFLEQGSVLMSLADGSSETILQAGETGEIVSGYVATSTEIPAEAHMGWLDNVLVLDKRPLASVIREVMHHFNILVVVPADLADAGLSGTLVLDDHVQILEDLALSIGAALEQPEPGRYILTTAGQN